MDLESHYIEEKKGIRRQYFSAISACMIAFLYGCDLGWVSPFLPLLVGKETPLQQPLSAVQVTALGSFICIGGLVGTPVLGFVSAKFGRKTAMLLALIPILISWILKMFWLTSEGLLTSRALSGFSGAAVYLVVPAYCVEVASPSTRGVLGSFLAFGLNLGIVTMYIIGAFVSYSSTIIILFVLTFSAMVFIGVAPESPIFLVKRAKYESAAKSIGWLRSESSDDPKVEGVLEMLRLENDLAKNEDSSSDEWSSKKSVSTYKLMFSGTTIRAFATCFALLTVQCFTGTFAVITYANDIFALSNGKLAPEINSIIVGLLQLTGSVVASALIERSGRKILLVVSCVLISSGMTIMGIYFYLIHVNYDLDGLGWIPATALSLVVSSFSVGIGPIPFILPSELITIKARGLANTLLIVWFWVMSFAVVVIFNTLDKATLIYAAFWIFAVCSSSGVAVTLLFLPETKGSSFKTVLEFYRKKKTHNSKITTR